LAYADGHTVQLGLAMWLLTATARRRLLGVVDFFCVEAGRTGTVLNLRP
jgi:hypothetical protein